MSTDFFSPETIVSRWTIVKKVLEYNSDKKAIEEIIKEIYADVDLNKLDKKTLQTLCVNLCEFYDMLSLAIENEWEKSGSYHSHFNSDQTINQIDQIQSRIFWKNISESENEENYVLTEISHNFHANKHKLSDDEISFFKNNLNLKWTINQEKISIQKEWLLSKKISSQSIIKLFEECLKLQWLNGWQVLINKDSSNPVCDPGKKIIYLPSEIKNRSLDKLLSLIDHEISVHAVRSNTVTGVTWWNWQESEEWFATLSENLIESSIQNLQIRPTTSHITTYMWELFWWEKLYRLLYIYFKLKSDSSTTPEEIKKMSKNRLLRVKRFYNMTRPWSNKKDLLYTRWALKLQKLFSEFNHEEKIDFLKKFYAKQVSIDALLEMNISDIEKDKEFNYPIWFGKVMTELILNPEITLEELRKKDFRFHISPEWNEWFKDRMIWIIDMVKKDDSQIKK